MDNDRKDEIVKAVANMEIMPVSSDENLDLITYEKIPFERLSSIGVAFDPLQEVLQKVVNIGEAGGTGIYKVTVPPGKTMAKFKDNRGFLGSVLTEEGLVGGGQAVITPLQLNPTMLFMAAALAGIDKKLDDIQETQQEILNFLVQKEKSELKGDLNFLQDVMDNYKFNWNNEKYKSSNHIKVLDIKQESERKIDFYREQLKSNLKKKALINTDADVKKQLDKIQDLFKDYQLSLYLFSYSSFLEVMLLENFDSEYLNGVVAKIEDYSFNYRSLYTNCYDRIEKTSKSSVESFLLKGFATANEAAGKTIEKIPLKSKLGVDEKLIKAGTKVREFNIKRTENKLERLIDSQVSPVHLFVENINNVNQLYNQPLELIFDNETLYLGTGERSGTI